MKGLPFIFMLLVCVCVCDFTRLSHVVFQVLEKHAKRLFKALVYFIVSP